jgi:hypothetical protein
LFNYLFLLFIVLSKFGYRFYISINISVYFFFNFFYSDIQQKNDTEGKIKRKREDSKVEDDDYKFDGVKKTHGDKKIILLMTVL